MPTQEFGSGFSTKAEQPVRRGLDLGCGTGLSGAAFRGMVDVLTGIDLSTKMIARAKAKGIYDDLVHVDISSFLTGIPQMAPPNRRQW